jgi:tetratricopeptide (TPR) repeat protein
MSTPELERLLEIARRQMGHGQGRAAIETLRRALALDPDNALAHALLAANLLDEKRLHAAASEAGRALALEPDGAVVRLVAGLVAISERRPERAREHLRHALLVDPELHQAWVALARVEELEDRGDAAKAHLERALELDPEDPETVTALGEWYRDRGDLAAALGEAQRALELAPEHPDGLVLMGSLLLRQGRVEEAREHAIWALQAGAYGGALALLAEVKTRRSFLLGLWWRWSAWIGNLGEGRSVAVLLGAFVVYRLAALAAQGLGKPEVANLIHLTWLMVVAYTWLAPGWFRRLLEEELGEVELERSF